MTRITYRSDGSHTPSAARKSPFPEEPELFDFLSKVAIGPFPTLRWETYAWLFELAYHLQRKANLFPGIPVAQ
jgi:hypothetical protein